MCNRLNNGQKVYPISKYGYGYKIFLKTRGKGKILTNYFGNNRVTVGKWLRWNQDKYRSWFGVNSTCGFCFFRGIKEANKLLNQLNYHSAEATLYKIQYKGGLGKRRETFYTSSLCEEYKILERVDL